MALRNTISQSTNQNQSPFLFWFNDIKVYKLLRSWVSWPPRLFFWWKIPVKKNWMEQRGGKQSLWGEGGLVTNWNSEFISTTLKPTIISRTMKWVLVQKAKDVCSNTVILANICFNSHQRHIYAAPGASDSDTCHIFPLYICAFKMIRKYVEFSFKWLIVH